MSVFSLSFDYFDNFGIPRTQTVVVNPVNGIYEINQSQVSVAGLTKRNFKELTNFLEAFSENALENKILPDNGITTIYNYVTSYLSDLSINLLLQFGISPTTSQTEPYVYSETKAHTLALNNVAIMTDDNTIIMALNIFYKSSKKTSSLKTKLLAFTKIYNGQKIITFKPNKLSVHDPYLALGNTIGICNKQIHENKSVIAYKDVYEFVKSMYNIYQGYVQQTIIHEDALSQIYGIMLILQRYSNPNEIVVMNYLRSENICNLLVQLRTSNCKSLMVGFSFVTVDYLTAEIQVLNS